MAKDIKKPELAKPNPKQTDIFDIPESIIPEDKQVYIPNWDNRPPQLPPIITINGKRVLTAHNFMVLVSSPGVGKTSVNGSLIADMLNPDCDSLGFTVSLQEPRNKILYVDTEQAWEDHWDAWAKTYERAGIKKPKIDHRFIPMNIKTVPFAKRKLRIEEMMEKNRDIGLIIIDGAGSFIKDTNDLGEAIGFVDWIGTFNPRIGIVLTLHTNPGSDKPRGHVGSQLCRDAYSVFLIRKIGDGVEREITTKFEFGKVRRDDDDISLYYKYSQQLQMFVSTDHTPSKTIKAEEKEAEMKEIARDIFTGKTECSRSYITEKIAEWCEVKTEGAKSIFKRHFLNKLVTKVGENPGDRYVLAEGAA